VNREILVFGDPYMDHIFADVERWPVLGQEVFASTLSSQPGGAFINSLALHRLEVNAAWVADLGNDDVSRAIRAAADAEGVNTAAFLEYDHSRRRITVAVTHEGNRGFISFKDPIEPPDFAEIIRQRRPGYVHSSGLIVGRPWCEIAHACAEVGARLLLDPQHNELRIDDPDLVHLLGHVEVILPNVEEAMAMTGQRDAGSAAEALGRFVPIVVVKDGCRGALLHHNGKTELVPVPIATTVVDTVGAGDCFDSGFVAAFAHDLPLRACTELAVICGSISVGGSGGSASPRASELAANYPHLVPWAV
jgi:sugar/nucleoside kinase (ribokinase family)